MSTSYTPTSNWTDRDLKGRDLRAKPVRPAEPVSFSSDPATDRLSRRMAADVRPSREDEAPSVPAADDDFMNRPMVNSSAQDAAIDGPDIFDAPMLNQSSPSRSMDDAVFDAPMVEARPIRPDRDEAIMATSASSAVVGDRYFADAHDDVITPTYGAAPRRKGMSPIMMVGVPVGVAAVAAVGWLALSGGEPAAPTTETAPPPLEITAATSAADPLINMPVSETGATIETAELAPAAAVPATPTPRPARSTPAQSETRAEAAPAERAPATAVTAEEPATPTVSPEPAPAPETSVETPAPLISTEPLSPQ